MAGFVRGGRQFFVLTGAVGYLADLPHKLSLICRLLPHLILNLTTYSGYNEILSIQI